MRLLKKMKIDTFRGLGSPGHDSPLDYRLTRIRVKNTMKFIDSTGVKMGTVLDIAGPSIVGQDIALCYRSTLLGTEGDLDGEWKTDCMQCDTVIMLEVIEHLLNPLAFLKQLKQVKFSDMIVSWPSRPSWLWTDFHYHELQLDRFEYLLKLAGYEMIAHQRTRLEETWYNKFTGIRPFFRYFVNRRFLAHIRKITWQ